jgi:hypothetical protein
MQDSQTAKTSGSMAIPIDASGDKAHTGVWTAKPDKLPPPSDFFLSPDIIAKKLEKFNESTPC